jgi:hypothetical protein
MEENMSQHEILEEIRKLSPAQLRSVIETAMKFLDDEERKAMMQKQRDDVRKKMTDAAERLREYYKPGSPHLVGDVLDEKDFHEPR